MSPLQNTTGGTGRIITFIREKISPRMTSLYDKLGFANRRTLISEIKKIETTDPNLVIEILTARGILKSRFQSEVSSLNDLREYMLKGKITRKKLSALNADLQTLGLSQVDTSFYSPSITGKIITGISAGYTSVVQYFDSHRGLAVAFSKGIKIATGIVALGGAYWFFGLPSITPGLILGALTATAVLAAKYNDKFPNYGIYKILGFFLRRYSRTFAPFLYAADGGYLGYLIYESNMNIANIFNSLGFEATVGLLLGAYLGIKYWVRKNVSEFERSYGGHLNPGKKDSMKKLMSSASYSSIADLHYLGVRVLLLGAASAYIAVNLLSSVGILGLLPFLFPPVGIYLTAKFRARKDFQYETPEKARRLDFLKMYSPYLGLGVGLLSSGVVSVLSGSWLPLIGYGTFWGSFGTLFLAELHGIFHSLNTTMGFITSLKTTAKDLIGEEERKKLTDKLHVLGINPNTGIKEHTYGILFSVVLNRKPGVSFICMYDCVLAQKDARGNLPNLQNFANEKAFLAKVRELQVGLFNIVYENFKIDSSDLPSCYEQLAANLEKLATHFETELKEKIDQLTSSHPDWFDPLVNLAEYRRAAFESLDIRAQELRRTADKLRTMAERGFVSAEHLREVWERLLRIYDPDYVTYFPVARKNLAGDERMVRKVENVATGLIQRGLTIYKGWFTETANDRLPAEDWIAGTWTRVPNPAFKYGAKSGLEAAKYIWVKRELVLTPLQKANEQYLSTSKWIASVDNNPDGQTGFTRGSIPVTIRVNEEEINVNEYYYSQDPNGVPPVRAFLTRDGRWVTELSNITGLPSNYQIATRGENNDLEPLVLFFPAFDYTLMMDKNDIQLTSYTQPDVIERERNNTFVGLKFRWPHPTLRELEVDNPYPDKEIDESKGIEVIDGNVEIINPNTGLIIPYKVDRGAAHVGVDEQGVEWQSLSKAKIEISNGEVISFSLWYGNREVTMPPRDWPRYLRWLFRDGKLKDGTYTFKINNFTKQPQREGQMAWLKIYYVDGTIGFARCPDGVRPTLFNKDLYGNGRP